MRAPQPIPRMSISLSLFMPKPNAEKQPSTKVAYGIPFIHRNLANTSTDPHTAQFVAFAGLCSHLSVNEFVTEVFFDTSSACFHLKVDARAEGTAIESILHTCIKRTLAQAELFGYIVTKVDDEARDAA